MDELEDYEPDGGDVSMREALDQVGWSPSRYGALWEWLELEWDNGGTLEDASFN